jgi:predicted ester cyclase
MARGILATTIALALLTGLVIGAIGRIGVLAPDSVPAFQSRNQQIGLDYFDAVDHLMRTGDSREVRLLLSADFQDHDPATDSVGGVESLIAEFQSLRNAFPGSRYAVTELASSGTLIVASITMHGTDSGEFAGIGIDLVQPSVQQEILRVRDGLIVERWSDAAVLPRLMTIATTGEISMSGVPALRQWHVDPHAHDVVQTPSEVILIMNKGTLIVEPQQPITNPARRYQMTPMSPNGVESIPLTGQQELREGDVLVAPGGTDLMIRNYSSEPAAMLSVAASFSQEDGPIAGWGVEGITSVLMARGFSLDAPMSRYEVFVGRVTLPPGSAFAHSGIEDGGEFIIAAEGSLTAEAVGGLVWTAASASTITADEVMQLSRREGAAIDGASEVRFEAAGSQPATFWVVTFVPIQQPAMS